VILLTVDGGETNDEPEELYALADVVHVACGGHAGDDASMTRVVRACIEHGTRIGAHPSYADREGFGRRACDVALDALEVQIREQCSALRSIAEREGTAVTSAKPHGALYHAAHADPGIAGACVRAIRAALGSVPIVGLAGGALEAAAHAAEMPYLVEAFADRGVRADGSLVPRGEPGALIEDPALAAARAAEIAREGTADTLCIHGDTPNAIAIAGAVRAALDRGA
jgi:5-oxoprolinase (ATP-hydrolysing) subunit A